MRHREVRVQSLRCARLRRRSLARNERQCSADPSDKALRGEAWCRPLPADLHRDRRRAAAARIRDHASARRRTAHSGRLSCWCIRRRYSRECPSCRASPWWGRRSCTSHPSLWSRHEDPRHASAAGERYRDGRPPTSGQSGRTFCVRAFGVAPRSSSSFATSAWPRRAAVINGVSPSLARHVRIGALPSRRAAIAGRSVCQSPATADRSPSRWSDSDWRLLSAADSAIAMLLRTCRPCQRCRAVVLARVHVGTVLNQPRHGGLIVASGRVEKPVFRTDRDAECRQSRHERRNPDA